MTGALAREILARTKGRPNVRYGTISATANGLANVRIGSTIVENATWLKTYAPVVGDRVAVLAGDSGWLILDAVETAKRAYAEQRRVTLPDYAPSGAGEIALRAWRYQRKRVLGESWDDDLSTPGIDPKPPESITGEDWADYLPSPDADHLTWTGLGPLWERGESPDGYLNYRPQEARSRIVLLLLYFRQSPGLFDGTGVEAVLPGDARIDAVALRIRLAEQQASPGVQRFRLWGLSMATMLEYPDLPPIEVEAMPGDAFDLPIEGEWLSAFQANLVDGFIIDAGSIPPVALVDPFLDSLTLVASYSTPLQED